MKNVTLSVDEDTLRQARQYAAAHGTTLNQMVRDLLKSTVAVPRGKSPLEEGFRLADDAVADSQGWRWNRAEIYDEQTEPRQ